MKRHLLYIIHFLRLSRHLRLRFSPRRCLLRCLARSLVLLFLSSLSSLLGTLPSISPGLGVVFRDVPCVRRGGRVFAWCPRLLRPGHRVRAVALFVFVVRICRRRRFRLRLLQFWFRPSSRVRRVVSIRLLSPGCADGFADTIAITSSLYSLVDVSITTTTTTTTTP